MRLLRRPTPALIAVTCLGLLLAFRLWRQTSAIQESPTTTQTVLVTRVVDGDTFDCADGQRVRLLGIDAPETYGGRQTAQPFAAEATQVLQELVLNQRVQLKSGPEAQDRYGRTLSWVFREDGLLVNAELLRRGAARLLPDFGLPVDLEPQLRAAEAEARVNRLGIWRKH